MLNNSSQPPKVCTNNQKPPNPCQCWDVGDFGFSGGQSQRGNCKRVELENLPKMTKPLNVQIKGLASKRCISFFVCKSIISRFAAVSQLGTKKQCQISKYERFQLAVNNQNLTDALQILESVGITGNTAVFTIACFQQMEVAA